MADFAPKVETLDNGNMLVTVGEKHLAKVAMLIGKANRRAEREGIEERIEVVDSREVMVADDDENMVKVDEVEISVPVLRKSGWEMVAALDFIEGGTIVRTVPGKSLEGWQRPDDRHCDHCQTNRERNRSFVVRSESGEVLQVGSSCLSAFLGFSPAMALYWMTFTEEFSEQAREWGSVYVPEAFSIEQVVRMSYVVSDAGRRYIPSGWVNEESTANEVRRVLTFKRGFGKNARQQEDEVRELRVAAADIPGELVSEIIEFGKNLTGGSDYVQNMLVILDSETVGPKHVGLLASLLKVWAKDREIEAERKANPVVNEHFGEVKVRIRGLKVTVTKVQCWEGDYGLTTLGVFRTEDGHVCKWFASGVKDFEPGDVLIMDATVKGHDEYNGIKQTIITRCSIKG